MAHDRNLRARLARDIYKSGSKDPETIAVYLLKQGWALMDLPEAKPRIEINNNNPIVLGDPQQVIRDRKKAQYGN